MAANISANMPFQAPEMIDIKEEIMEPVEIKTEPVDDDWEVPFLNRDGLKQVNVQEDYHFEMNDSPGVALPSQMAQFATRIKTEPNPDPLALDDDVIPPKEELLYENACSINPLLEDEKVDHIKCEPPVPDNDLMRSEILRELLLMPILPNTKGRADTPLKTKKVLDQPPGKRILPRNNTIARHGPSSSGLGLVQSRAGSAMCTIPREVCFRHVEAVKVRAVCGNPASHGVASKGGGATVPKKLLSEQEKLKQVKDHLLKELNKLKNNQLRYEGIANCTEIKRRRSHNKIFRSLRKNFRKELQRAAIKLDAKQSEGYAGDKIGETLKPPAREEVRHHVGNSKPKGDELNRILSNHVTLGNFETRTEEAQVHSALSRAKPGHHKRQGEDELSRNSGPQTEDVKGRGVVLNRAKLNRIILNRMKRANRKVEEVQVRGLPNLAEPEDHKRQEGDEVNRVVPNRIERGDSEPETENVRLRGTVRNKAKPARAKAVDRKGRGVELNRVLLNRMERRNCEPQMENVQFLSTIQNVAETKHRKPRKDERNHITMNRGVQVNSESQIEYVRGRSMRNEAKPKGRELQDGDKRKQIVPNAIERGDCESKTEDEQVHSVSDLCKRKLQDRIGGLDIPAAKCRKRESVDKLGESVGRSTDDSGMKHVWSGSFWGCSLCTEMHFFSSKSLTKHKAAIHPNDSLLAYFVSSVSSSTSEQKVTTSKLTGDGITRLGEYALVGDRGDLPDHLRTTIVNKIAALSRDFGSRGRRNPPSSSICEFCGKVFTHLGDCNKHRRSHTGERPHVCNVDGCKTSFATHSNLSRHRKLHLGVKYRCPLCDVTYSRRDKLNSHAKVCCGRSLLLGVADDDDGPTTEADAPSVLTADEVIKMDAGRGVAFLCQTCKKTFADVWAFIGHREMHASAPPDDPSDRSDLSVSETLTQVVVECNGEDS